MHSLAQFHQKAVQKESIMMMVKTPNFGKNIEDSGWKQGDPFTTSSMTADVSKVICSFGSIIFFREIFNGNPVLLDFLNYRKKNYILSLITSCYLFIGTRVLITNESLYVRLGKFSMITRNITLSQW